MAAGQGGGNQVGQPLSRQDCQPAGALGEHVSVVLRRGHAGAPGEHVEPAIYRVLYLVAGFGLWVACLLHVFIQAEESRM